MSEIFKAILATKANDAANYYVGPARVLGDTTYAGNLGMVFPNTPMIQTSYTANYDDYDLTHTNYAYWAYKNSKIDNITVIGKFTQNTSWEADYLVGAIHFLRSVTKMHFGEADPKAGTPPPVLEFSAMGDEMYNKVPVIVTNFSTNFEDVYDYVSTTDRLTQVPTTTMITVTLNVFYNPSDLQRLFSLGAFKDGSLLGDGYI